MSDQPIDRLIDVPWGGLFRSRFQSVGPITSWRLVPTRLTMVRIFVAATVASGSTAWAQRPNQTAPGASARPATPATASLINPDVERRRLLGRPGFGADVVLLSGEAGLRQELNIGAARSDYWLALLLRLKADPAALIDPVNGFNLAALLPDRLAPYLEGGGQPDPQTRVTASPAWKGQNEFERADTRNRFIANETENYLRLIPSLPMTVAFAERLQIRGEYDAQRQGFRIESRWGIGGLPREMDGSPAPLVAPEPYSSIDFLPMPPDAARRLRERQATLQAAQQPRRSAAAPAQPGLGLHTLLLVRRYQIQSVRGSASSGITVEAAAVDIRIVDSENPEVALAGIALPRGAIRGDAPSGAVGPTPGAPILLDDELPLLLMARGQPGLLNDQNFVLAAFMVRRAIEARNITCGTPQGNAATCVPTSWRDLISSAVAQSQLPPLAEDVRAYGTGLRTRVATLGDTIIVSNPCGLTGVCQPVPDGTTRLDLGRAFGPAVRNTDARPVSGVVPDAPGFSSFSQSRGNAGSILPEIAQRLTIQVLVAQRLNAAWDGLIVADPSNVTVEFKVFRFGFGARVGAIQQFVFEVGPVAVVSRRRDGTIIRTSLVDDKAAITALERTGEVPFAPWDLAGVRLGMPLAEAVEALRTGFATVKSSELDTPISTAGQSACTTVRRDTRDQIRQRLSRLPAGSPQSERDAVAAEVRASSAARLLQFQCPDTEAAQRVDPLVFGYGLLVDHGGDLRELIVLFRNGDDLGSPLITAVHREVFGLSVVNRYAVSKGMVERYGPATVVTEPLSPDPGQFWLENQVRRTLFAKDGACGKYWSGGSGYLTVPTIPDEYRAADCGAFLRYDKNRALLVDTRYLSTAVRNAPARERSPSGQPQIKF